MKRPWFAVIAILAAIGCRGSQATTNPFLRTTVPPPATGAGAVVVPGEQYYGTGVPPTLQTSPGVAAPPPGAISSPAPMVTTPAPMVGAPPPSVAPAVPAAPPIVSPPPPVVAPPPVVIPPKDKFGPPGGSYIYNQS